MKFIELTKMQVIEPIGEYAPVKIMINSSNIKELKEDKEGKGGCLLIMNDNEEIEVKESKYEILKKLNNEKI